MIELGYDTHNPILVLKTLILLQIMYFVKLALLFWVLYPLQRFVKSIKWKKKIKRYYKNLFRVLIFDEILIILFSSLIELLLAWLLYSSTPDNNPNKNLFHTIFSYYIMAIPLIILPGIFFWMFTKSLKQIKRPGF